MRALILVDLQNDFVSGGAMPVPDGRTVVPVANRVQARLGVVVATQDWHPADHGSFAASHPAGKVGDVIDLNGLEQILWPVHCVRETPGAALIGKLDQDRITKVIRKGTDPAIDSYSGFFDNGHRNATGLADFLNQNGVGCVYIMGLATDYCVKFTALDAVKLGFQTYLVEDGCRGINLRPGDVAAAVREMARAGVKVIGSKQVSA